MLEKRVGVISSIKRRRTGLTEVLVIMDGREEPALNYDALTGEVAEGDRVLLNTTAVSKNLGTGGYHFIIAVEGKYSPDPPKEGHIMKLRYTPFQVKVHSVEEEDHPGNVQYKKAVSLEGTPVVICTLHSMIAMVSAAVKYIGGPGKKVTYIMTDGAALPIWLSNTVADLKARELLDETITCGHAFGGDFEAVNIYSGLLWAAANGSSVIIAAMGPGIVGTASEFGNTAIEQGEIINAVNVLNGRPIAVPRISFADPRERHQGLSHHTITSLARVALTRCTVPLPLTEGQQKKLLDRQINESGIHHRHHIIEVDTGIIDEILEAYDLNVNSMGRTPADDPVFFRSACAAGIYAAGLLQPGGYKTSDCSLSSAAPAQNKN